MRQRLAVLTLLGVQMALVLSVAGKYWYERKTCPRVWVRATQRDPEQPLRGRYLALQPLVDVCGLPRNPAHYTPSLWRSTTGEMRPGTWTWRVSLTASGGQLRASLEEDWQQTGAVYAVRLPADAPYARAPVQVDEEYFVPEHAKGPFPLRKGQELWVEVTVPPRGPPRPIQMALSDGSEFRPIRME